MNKEELSSPTNRIEIANCFERYEKVKDCQVLYGFNDTQVPEVYMLWNTLVEMSTNRESNFGEPYKEDTLLNIAADVVTNNTMNKKTGIVSADVLHVLIYLGSNYRTGKRLYDRADRALSQAKKNGADITDDLVRLQIAESLL